MAVIQFKGVGTHVQLGVLSESDNTVVNFHQLTMPRPVSADVIQRWESLRAAAMDRQRTADTLITLQERIRSFRHALLGLDERATRASAKVENVDELQSRISALQVRSREAVV